MKKIILLLNVLLMTGILLGQTPKKSRRDLWIYKSTPAIFLQGNGALINFNNGDLILTQSPNVLTLSGGNLALETNSLTMTGSIGATGSRVTKGWFTNLEITNLPTISGASLSALYTSGNISIGTNSLLLTGSIAATGSRVTKGWFTNLEITNLPSINGTSIFTSPSITTAINPVSNDGAALGTSSLMWSDLFLASGSVINFNNGDVTLTHGSNVLTLGGGDLAIGANNITGTGSLGATGAGKLTKVWSVDAEFTNLPTIAGAAIHTAPSFTTSITIDAAGDTTVTAAKGKIVYKSSDDHFYGCISTTNVSTPKWKRLDN